MDNRAKHCRGPRYLTALYIDSSAWVKRYIDESGSSACALAMSADPTWVTCRVTIVEVTRTLAARITPDDAHEALDIFNAEVCHVHIAEVDMHLCALASQVAIQTGARSLDALHIAAALRTGSGAVAFLTYDVRQAAAARSMGLYTSSPT